MRKITKYYIFLVISFILYILFFCVIGYSLLKTLLIIFVPFVSFFLIKFIKWVINKFRKDFSQEIVLYMGETGAGKTSCAVAQGILYHKQMDKYIRKNLSPLYAQLESEGYPVDINAIPTFIYSDTTILLDKRKGLCSCEADFLKLGIPDLPECPQVAKYPIGAYLIFDEIPLKADSRNWQKFNRNLGAYFNFHRKAYQSVALIAQNIEDVEKRIRDRVHKIRYMLSMSLFHIPFTNIYKTTWEYIEYTGPARFKNCQNGVIPNLLDVFTQYKTCSIWCNIFERYDSRSEIAYFLRTQKPFACRMGKPFVLTRESILEYLKSHPLPSFVEEKKKDKKP